MSSVSGSSGIYAVIFLDAIHYHVGEEGRIIKKAVYICMGIDMEGRKDILGLWISENEGSRFWLSVINDLKNQGVEDVLIDNHGIKRNN